MGSQEAMLRVKAMYKYPLSYHRDVLEQNPSRMEVRYWPLKGCLNLMGFSGSGFLLTTMAEFSDVWCPYIYSLAAIKVEKCGQTVTALC